MTWIQTQWCGVGTCPLVSFVTLVPWVEDVLESGLLPVLWSSSILLMCACITNAELKKLANGVNCRLSRAIV